jgi:hypothetical protein
MLIATQIWSLSAATYADATLFALVAAFAFVNGFVAKTQLAIVARKVIDPL